MCEVMHTHRTFSVPSEWLLKQVLAHDEGFKQRCKHKPVRQEVLCALQNVPRELPVILIFLVTICGELLKAV